MMATTNVVMASGAVRNSVGSNSIPTETKNSTVKMLWIGSDSAAA